MRGKKGDDEGMAGGGLGAGLLELRGGGADPGLRLRLHLGSGPE